MANERDEGKDDAGDEDKGTRTRRGRRRVGGDGITRSKTRAVGHRISFQTQRALHPYSTFEK
jgi:hypothetical protein